MKNKTHRIISISPTSQNSSLRSTQNKTTTPIKPIQHPTRTNTIKTAFRPEDSQILEEDSQGGSKNSHVIQSVVVSSYRDREDGKGKRDSFKIDQILNRIGKTYEGEKGNASTELIKKTQIGYLREFIRQAKNLIKIRQENDGDPFALNQGSNPQIETISSSIRQQISTFFSTLHKELYSKQKQIYEELDQKIFQLKQKNITKCYQIATLKNYIEKCETDINSNYEAIINEIEVKQLNQIVNSYTKRLEFYMEKIRANQGLRVDLPGEFQLSKILPHVEIVIERNPGEPMNLPQKAMLLGMDGDQNRLSLDSKSNLPDFHHQIPKITLQKRINIKSAFEQVQNLPLSRLIHKKLKNTNECEPRIASARGKY